jgi:hypothetical protein
MKDLNLDIEGKVYMYVLVRHILTTDSEISHFVVLPRPWGGSNPRTSRPRRHWCMSTMEMSV